MQTCFAILRFGFPSKIHHDQGGEFENELFYRLEELSDVIHSRTTPYHPQDDGKAERFNRIALSMLRTLQEAYKSYWRDHLPKLVHVYNCTRHEATGFSPFALLFGRSPRLPIDLLFGIGMKQPSKNYPSYVTQWGNAVQEAYQIAASNSSKSASKQRYSMKRKPMVSHFYPVIECLSRTLKKVDQVRFVLTGNRQSTEL